MKLKSPQAQFVLNQRSIGMSQVMTFPFEIEDLTNIRIQFRNQLEAAFYYKVVLDDNSDNFLSKYFILPEKNKNINQKIF